METAGVEGPPGDVNITRMEGTSDEVNTMGV